MRRGRLYIRIMSYQGKRGYLLHGNDTAGHPVQIFDVDKRVLDAIRKVYRTIKNPHTRSELINALLFRKVSPDKLDRVMADLT